MRFATGTIAASLAWTACSTAGTAPPMHVQVGTNFSLKIGESAQAREPSLQVGFENVTADSRCPQGEQCIVAGDATVRVWLQRGEGPREALALNAAPGAAQAVHAWDYEVRLVRLEPHPITGKAVAQRDYVATLVLNRGSATGPDR